MKFIDLFAGIGGFRLGMEMAGHEAVGWCETDKFAQKSYRAIHEPEGEWFADDIRTVNPGDIPDFDCICGGFPCQSFSIAGKRGGFEDTRGTLFFEIARIIQARKPKIVFLENVEGLLSHENGSTFETILRTLGELGYWYEYQVLNSKNFGIPQNRERVFIVGHLRGASFRQVFPIRESNKETLKQVVGGSQGYRIYDPSGISCTLASEAGGMGAKTGLYFIDLSKQKAKITNKGGFHDIAPTITKNSYEHNNHLIDNTRIRRLTPKECFRLQGFPDWAYERAESVNSDSQLYKQAGNGVTVNVIYEIAKRL